MSESPVNWAETTHAYGPATDIPDLLKMLESDERSERNEARWQLYGNVYHQGTRYPASALIVPFLVRLAANPAIHERDEIIYLINGIAVGYDSSVLPKGMEPVSWRKRLEERRNLDVNEEKRQLDQWVNEAANDKKRRKRGWQRVTRLEMRKWDLKRWENAVVAYDAVRDKAVPTLCSILQDDPDYTVRAAAAHTLSHFPECVDKSIPILRSILFESSEDITSVLLGSTAVAFVLLYCNSESSEPDRRTVEEKLQKLLGSENSMLRCAAATGLARLEAYDIAVIRELAEATVNKSLSQSTDVWLYSGNLGQYPLLCLQDALNVSSLSESVAGAALDPILNGLTPETFFSNELFRIICKLLWKTPENNPVQGSNPVPFEDLQNEREKTFFKSLAETKDFIWIRLQKDLKLWKLPGDRDSCRRYVGLPPEGPYETAIFEIPGDSSDEGEDELPSIVMG